MKRSWLIALVLVCLPLAAIAFLARIPAQPSQAVTARQLVTISENTPTASTVPSPTLDAIATMQVDTNNARATSQNAAAAQTTAEYKQLRAEQTSVKSGVDKASIDATAQAFSVGATQARESTGATEVAFSVGATQTHTAQDYIYATQTQQAPANELIAKDLRSRADTSGLRAVVDALAPVLWLTVIIAGIVLIVTVLNKWASEQSAPVQYDKNVMEDVPVQPSAPVRLYEKENSTINRDTEPPGDPEKFRALIRHAEAGNPLGANKVVGFGKPYASYTEYSPVMEWMEKHQYITKNNHDGKVFNADGEVFCFNWESAHPCPNA